MDLDLNEINARAREAAAVVGNATAGPWYAHSGEYGEWDIAFTGCGNDGQDQCVSTSSTIDTEETDADADAAFIAASRTAVPALAADVLALLGRVEELEYNNSALSWLLSECGGMIPFRLPDAMEQLRARVAELKAQLIAARAEQVTR